MIVVYRSSEREEYEEIEEGKAEEMYKKWK